MHKSVFATAFRGRCETEKKRLADHAVCCLKKKCELMSSRNKRTFMNGTGLNLALPHFQSPVLLDKG